MYSTLFTTTLVFALLAPLAWADFDVATVKLTQVSDSHKNPRFSVPNCSFCLVWTAVPAREPHLG